MKKLKSILAITALFVLALPMAGHAVMGGGGGSTTNTTQQQTTNQVTSTVASLAATANVGMLTNHIAGMTGGVGGTGSKSSGNGPNGIGVWALGSGQYLDKSASGKSYDGSLFNGMIGADKQFGDLLVGLGFGYENLDLKTKYNGGNIGYDGWSLVPYIAYSFSKTLVADASFSYTWLDYTMKDSQGGVKYKDDMGATRMVTSLGLTQYYNIDKFLLSGRIGTLYMDEQHDSYQLKNTVYGKTGLYTWQGSLGLRAAYDMGDLKPFVGATYMQDFIKSGGKHNDMWGTDFELGLNYNISKALVLGVTGTYGIREDFYKAGGLVNLRYDF